jgi:TolA-binding protein
MHSLTFRSRSLRFAAATLLFCGLVPPRAHAVSKDMVELQTQIRQLQDAVARLQQSNDERMGVMKDLVQQTADAVNKMSVEMNGVKLGLQNQQDAMGTKTDQISGQVQSLNDSLDELKARMARMEKLLGDVKNQQQTTAAILNNLPAGGGAPAGNVPAPAAANGRPLSDNSAPAQSQPAPPDPGTPQAAAAPPQGPDTQTMYRTAYTDYMSAKYVLATSEFNEMVKNAPDDNLSGNAYFYLGEIALRTQKPVVAIKNYDHLIEHFPDNQKVPAAHLHKGEAMISMKQTENGVRELRALIQRFPNSPESSQARQRLAALHVSAGPQ